MWRFLNNIPRAFKNYHAPRASVGVYKDAEDKDQESYDAHQEKDSDLHSRIPCAPVEASHNLLNHDQNERKRNIFGRFFARKNNGYGSKDQSEGNHTREEDPDQHDWWNCCQNDVLAFLQRSNRMPETFAVGSYHSKKNQRSDFIYRILFSIFENDEIVKTVNRQDVSTEGPKNGYSTTLAIKDAKGAAHDHAVNSSQPEDLDTAVKAFEHVCLDHTAYNESLLALTATDQGQMSEAIKHFQVSCSMGNGTACFNLGLCYETGSGVTMNLEKAMHYYELAVLKGHRQAMYNLSLLYLNEDGEDSQEKGLELMEMAAKAGVAQAQTYMGLHHMEVTGHTTVAAAFFTAAASQNDRDAQYFLGLCHEHGLGVEVNECRAAHQYSIGASLDHDAAIFNLARFHENGLGGMPCDSVTAHALYRKAAKLGNEEGKHRLEELETLKQEEEQNTNLCRMEDLSRHGSKQNMTSPINLSVSTPDLGAIDKIDNSLPGNLYQRLFSFFQTSDSNSQSIFDPGGGKGQNGTFFYIGRSGYEKKNISVCDEMSGPVGEGASGVETGTLGPFQHSHVHRSNTTPDLSSLVTCNL